MPATVTTTKMALKTIGSTATVVKTATKTTTSLGVQATILIPDSSCITSYQALGNDINNVVDVFSGPKNSLKCCELCQKRVNCVASFFNTRALLCQHLLRNVAVAGELTNTLCPLGVQDYDLGRRFRWVRGLRGFMLGLVGFDFGGEGNGGRLLMGESRVEKKGFWTEVWSCGGEITGV